MKVIQIEVPASHDDDYSKPTPRYKQTIITSAEGEVISDVTTMARSKNGGGFVISYTAKMCEFLEKTRQGSTVRIFLYLAHHQNYGKDDVFGFRTSRAYLSKVLRLDAKTVYSALEYLLENFLIVENRIDGSLEFMVNPAYVTIGNDRKLREKVWNERWAMRMKHLGDKELKGV